MIYSCPRQLQICSTSRGHYAWPLRGATVLNISMGVTAGTRPAGAQDVAQHQHGDCCHKTLQTDMVSNKRYSAIFVELKDSAYRQKKRINPADTGLLVLIRTFT